MHRPRTQLLLCLAGFLAGAPAWAQAPAAEKSGPPPAGQSIKNTLRWKTNGGENQGFDVYRAVSESGPFVKLTAHPVDGRGTAGQPEFAYVDDTIEPGRAYWYYVEVIDPRGERRRLTPVTKAPAKGPRSSAPTKP